MKTPTPEEAAAAERIRLTEQVRRLSLQLAEARARESALWRRRAGR